MNSKQKIQNVFWPMGLILLLICSLLTGCASQTAETAQDPAPSEEPLPPLRLEMTQETFPLDAEVLPWRMINETDQTCSVWLIPTLEQLQADDTWQTMDCTAGFCGVADPLSEQIDGDIATDWYPDLAAGTYRLSYDLQQDDTRLSISAQFELFEPEE